jgi:hypothetical protein
LDSGSSRRKPGLEEKTYNGPGFSILRGFVPGYFGPPVLADF